jgi:predicted RNA-binding protein with PUA-like domain
LTFFGSVNQTIIITAAALTYSWRLSLATNHFIEGLMPAATNYWLMKSEPDCYSIDDLASEKNKTTHWDGVRNYQARNFMRDQMKKGDKVLFYHSNAKPPGVAGVARIAKESYPDFTAFDPQNKHFDPKSRQEEPRWFMVDIKFEKKLKRLVSLDELRKVKSLEGMVLLQKGSRLSVQPVTKRQFETVVKLADKPAPA